MKNRFILNFTPTGMIPTKDMSPHVPLSPEEIIREVLQVSELGITMVHLHARDLLTGMPTFKKEVYGEIIQGIREKNKDLILGVSTSGRDFTTFEERSDCLDLEGIRKPDFASLTLSSLNFNKQASVNSPDMIQSLARKMMGNGIRPELEAFDLGMINYSNYLIRKGLLQPPYYFNLILGNIACAQADMLHLGLMVKELPEHSLWSVGGIGHSQLKMNVLSIISGGGVRIGLEDNIWFDDERTTLATNRSLVERIVDIARVLGYEPLPPGEARQLFGL
ncbi:MAG: 3-keto-5-aminohexanoate cleavage protein [Syntrophaceae bacterium]